MDTKPCQGILPVESSATKRKGRQGSKAVELPVCIEQFFPPTGVAQLSQGETDGNGIP